MQHKKIKLIIKKKKTHWEGGINCSSDGPDYTRSSGQISAPAQFEYLSEDNLLEYCNFMDLG
jgi:hypothetical protein